MSTGVSGNNKNNNNYYKRSYGYNNGGNKVQNNSNFNKANGKNYKTMGRGESLRAELNGSSKANSISHSSTSSAEGFRATRVSEQGDTFELRSGKLASNFGDGSEKTGDDWSKPNSTTLSKADNAGDKFNPESFMTKATDGSTTSVSDKNSYNTSLTLNEGGKDGENVKVFESNTNNAENLNDAQKERQDAVDKIVNKQPTGNGEQKSTIDNLRDAVDKARLSENKELNDAINNIEANLNKWSSADKQSGTAVPADGEKAGEAETSDSEKKNDVMTNDDVKDLLNNMKDINNLIENADTNGLTDDQVKGLQDANDKLAEQLTEVLSEAQDEIEEKAAETEGKTTAVAGGDNKADGDKRSDNDSKPLDTRLDKEDYNSALNKLTDQKDKDALNKLWDSESNSINIKDAEGLKAANELTGKVDNENVKNAIENASANHLRDNANDPKTYDTAKNMQESENFDKLGEDLKNAVNEAVKAFENNDLVTGKTEISGSNVEKAKELATQLRGMTGNDKAQDMASKLEAGIEKYNQKLAAQEAQKQQQEKIQKAV